jgi:F-type H+-transporting ATPase subunit gamma
VATFQENAKGTAEAAYIYEPGEAEILDEIVPRFTALQVYQAILESLASEHAARMVAMKNATDSATELAGALQLEYNNVRQQTITNEMLDIAGGAEALAKSLEQAGV